MKNKGGLSGVMALKHWLFLLFHPAYIKPSEYKKDLRVDKLLFYLANHAEESTMYEKAGYIYIERNNQIWGVWCSDAKWNIGQAIIYWDKPTEDGKYYTFDAPYELPAGHNVLPSAEAQHAFFTKCAKPVLFNFPTKEEIEYARKTAWLSTYGCLNKDA